jgi:hypothetical protein
MLAAIATSGHCSALIQVTGDLSQLLFAHSSWFVYASMLRTYKHYSFAHRSVYTAAQVRSPVQPSYEIRVVRKSAAALNRADVRACRSARPSRPIREYSPRWTTSTSCSLLASPSCRPLTLYSTSVCTTCSHQSHFWRGTAYALPIRWRPAVRPMRCNCVVLELRRNRRRLVCGRRRC